VSEEELLPVNALLKRARLAAGMTQIDLARVTGFTQSYVSTMERGKVTPTLATVNLVAAATGHTLTLTLAKKTQTTKQGSPMTITVEAPTVKISDAERKRREERVATAIHDAELEHGSVSPATQADMDSYARGQFDSDTLLAKVQARYGIRH
jgi:transcriptional regulator with XRE-family HTH domain